jgi:hypothetical protein
VVDELLKNRQPLETLVALGLLKLPSPCPLTKSLFLLFGIEVIIIVTLRSTTGIFVTGKGSFCTLFNSPIFSRALKNWVLFF